jgi:hypothetical protein
LREATNITLFERKTCGDPSSQAWVIRYDRRTR